MVNPKPHQPIKHLSWYNFEIFIKELAFKIKKSNTIYTDIYGIPRGGLIIAVKLSHLLNIPVSDTISQHTLIVDDISDSGKTLSILFKTLRFKHDTACLFMRYDTNFIPTFCYCIIKNNNWIEFPWESK